MLKYPDLDVNGLARIVGWKLGRPLLWGLLGMKKVEAGMGRRR